MWCIKVLRNEDLQYNYYLTFQSCKIWGSFEQKRKKSQKSKHNVLPQSSIIYEENTRIWVTLSLTSFPCLLSTQTYFLAKLITECLVSLICYSLVFQPKSYLLPFSCSWLPMTQHCLPHRCLLSQGFLLCCPQSKSHVKWNLLNSSNMDRY